MNALLIVASLVMCAGIVALLPTEGGAALLLSGTLALLWGGMLTSVSDDKEFLLRIFVAGLLLRLGVATFVNVADLHEFFGPDTFTYDSIGFELQQTWEDFGFSSSPNDFRQLNYGMGFVVAVIYSIVGRSILAVQFVNAVSGAATLTVIYLCARHIFENKTVARFAALCVAFYPSLVLWSSQGLKDALTVFFVTIVVLATLKLSEGFKTIYVVALLGALFGVLTMRFYVFYMAIVASTGALLIGTRRMSSVSLLKQFFIVMVVAIALAYVGVHQTATEQFETFASLESIQRTRTGQATAGASSYAESADVTTASGALAAIPISMAYLLFAPFPWQVTNLRQAITLPEMIVWWGMCPLLVLGLWFTLKYRVRQAFVILIFTSMLTLAYSLFQSNIGAAYRQRSQLLVFYFIFVAVGVVLLKERREKRRRERDDLIALQQQEITRMARMGRNIHANVRNHRG